MTFEESIDEGVRLLKDKGQTFDDGLSDGELSAIEDHFQFTFPPDVRYFLQLAHPTSAYFVNWRTGFEDLHSWFHRIPEGILFDVRHNVFWSADWGLRPSNAAESLRLAQDLILKAPKLIPIGDPTFPKCIPESPRLAGNPMFSVRQADVLHAGRDIGDFLRWFGRPNESFERDEATAVPPTPPFSDDYRFIPFWTDIAKNNASY